MKDRPANPVPRFVVEHNNDKSGEGPNRLSIASLRDLPAYVLLGEPGLGKSLCFENEAKTCNGLYYSVADFLHLPEAEKNITADKTIFIDGLDESGEPHAIEKLRQQLSNTGWPSFRISCRAADWFGDNAAKKLTPPSITNQRKSIQVFDLCTLDIDDIKTILQTEYKEHNPDAFLQRANSFGVLDLARNPQTLRYLVTAMKQGLPSDTSLTKKIVFERACSALAIERNNEHILKRTVGREIDTKRIITTSQQTFAFMLVTGRSGISETDNAADESWPGPMAYNQRVADVAEASHSSLFRTTNTTSHFAPAHRTIAEFLGAQWLAARIDDAQSKPLSKRRLHRLLTHDNRVVPSLRGLVGWLTALSPDMFETLADADPLAIVEYGDVAPLSITQRRHLFSKLIFHAGQPHEWLSRRLKHSEGMRTLLRDFEAHDVLPWLQSSEWTEAQRDSAILLLQTRMHNEAALPSWLAECAAARMRDIVTPIEIRIAALELWLNRAPAATADAIPFLASLAADQTLDRTNQLRAALLRFLCPHKLSAVDAIKYLVQPSQRIGEYESWLIALPSLVPTEHLGAFADAWLQANLVATYDDFVVGNVEDQLVKRLLLELGTTATAPQLLSWLHIGIQNHRDRDLQIADEIRSWLRVHIDVCKRIWAHVHDECAVAGTQWNQKIYDAERAMSLVLHRNSVDALLDETQPFIHTMGEWLVTEATRLKTGGALQDLVLSILWNANACLPKPSTRGTRATAVEHWLQQNPAVLLHVNQASAAFESRQHGYRVQHQTSEDRWEAKRDNEFATYLTVEAAAIAGNADWKALDFLADVWSSSSGDFHETKWVNALQRFESHFGTMDNRAARVFEVTQTAMLGVLYRPDLPSAEQLRTAHGNNRRHLAVRPILLAAHLLWLRDHQAIATLPLAALRTLLFAYFVDDRCHPIWLESLMHESPHVVANCWLEFTKSAFADKQYRASLIFHLASSTQTTDRASLAKLVAVPTLELLPIPLHSEHTVTLQVLLHLAWQYDRDSLRHLATQKLQYTSLDEVQATYWRLVQFLCSPKMKTEEIFTFLMEPERTQIRASLVLALLHGTHWSSFDLREYQLPPLVVGRLVELCAMSVTLADNIADGVVTSLGDDWKNRQVIDMLLRMIASVPSVAALAETMRLGALSSLAKLQKNIAWLASEQRRSILEASYQRPTLSEALKILGTDEPISREDLFERVSDVLETLGEELRTNPTTMVKRCWNLNGSNYESPKEENECRDWLIDELKHRMRIQGSDAQPEVQFVNNKRADIVVSFRGWRLPLEIKRSMHPEVWTAWNNQVEQYTQERGTGGYAIYLILWFDVTPRVRPPGQSHAPATASEYATLLQSLIRDSGKANIRAMLLDVSEPIAKPEAKAKAKPRAESKPAKPAQPAQAKAGNARPKPAKATPAKPANSTKTSPRK